MQTQGMIPPQNQNMSSSSFLPQFQKEDNVPEEIPKDLLSLIKKRCNRSEKSRFPYKIWALLSWVGDRDDRAEKAGCKWVSETDFYINKQKLVDVMGVKLNTLNVNLNSLGFEQIRKCSGLNYYKNHDFSKSSFPNFERIKNSRSRPYYVNIMNIHAAFLPLLDSLCLFGMEEREINSFKMSVIKEWENITKNSLVFAIHKESIIRKIMGDVNDQRFEAFETDLEMVLQSTTPKIINIYEFAVFLARFGPFSSTLDKLSSYKKAINAITMGQNTWYSHSALHTYFSATYHNCFRLKIGQNGEYHIYNSPIISSESVYLRDEDGSAFNSWKDVVEKQRYITL